jgi:hypothetical protein
MMTRRRSALLLLLVVGLAGLAGLIVRLPMAQAARLLVSGTRGAVTPLAAHGVWHDGTLHLACLTPGGRRLDCGRYAVSVERAGLGITLALAQPGGGSARLIHSGLAWRGEADRVRLPATALAAWLPIVEQMQIGGQLQVSGRADATGAIALNVRWQGEIGEFFIGEQGLHIEGNTQRFSVRFTPSDNATQAGESSRAAGSTGVSFSGEVKCEAAAGSAAPRCRGEVFVNSAGADRRLEQLLVAAGRQVAPGRYRFQVDAS